MGQGAGAGPSTCTGPTAGPALPLSERCPALPLLLLVHRPQPQPRPQPRPSLGGASNGRLGRQTRSKSGVDHYTTYQSIPYSDYLSMYLSMYQFNPCTNLFTGPFTKPIILQLYEVPNGT